MKTLIEEPPRIRLLPHDKHGRPVPWFVAWIDGAPEFRVVKRGAFEQAIGHAGEPSQLSITKGGRVAAFGRPRVPGVCWVCGVIFQRQEDRVFVIGPMCTLNRISAEPPAHLECAVYSALACPFLNTPNMVRRTTGLEKLGAHDPGGVMLLHNPGVAAVWTTKYNAWGQVIKDPEGGKVIRMGLPKSVQWYTQAREATRVEVLEGLDLGLPRLLEAVQVEKDDAEAAAEIDKRLQELERWLPAA